MSVKSVTLYTILFLLSVLMVFLVDMSTFVYREGHGISGNGNPGLLVLFPAWALGFMLMVATFVMAVRYFDVLSEHIVKLPYHLWVPVLSVLALILAVFLQLRKIQYLYHALREFTDENGSMYLFDNINPYTNSLYYNAHILMFSVAFAVLCGWYVVRRRTH